MTVPARPLSVWVVIVRDLEAETDDQIDSIWTFSSGIVADVWVERRTLQDPTLGYSTFEVELDAGIVELPTREG